MKHKIIQVNAGSMADIAFLLLVFFLLVTTIHADKGLLRVLPGMDDKVSDLPANKVLSIAINANGELMANNQELSTKELGVLAYDFLTNGGIFKDVPVKSALPKRHWVELNGMLDAGLLPNDTLIALEMFGNYKALPKEAIICVAFHSDVKYERYIEVLNLLDSCTNNLRDEICEPLLDVPYRALSDSEADIRIKRAVRVIVPNCITELAVSLPD